MASPTTLVLVRHGEIVRPVGTSNFDSAPLSPVGEQQVATLAHHWPAPRPEIVVSSDLPRAVQTARILGAILGVSLDLRPSLREWTPDESDLSHGEFLALEARCWDDLDFVPPSGETLRDAAGRIDRALRDLARSHRQGIVAVAGHGALFSLFATAIEGVRPTRALKDAVPFAGYAIVRYDGAFELVSGFRTIA